MTDAVGAAAPGASETPARRGARRSPRAPTAGPLLLYLLLACLVLLPIASPRLVGTPSADFRSHVSGVVEARDALAEGQFPLRVAPGQHGGARYPIFQYYGNLPYTLGGLFSLAPGVNPYTGFKLVLLLSLTAGGFYAYRAGLTLARGRRAFAPAAVIAGAVFMTAPYMWTDIHSRFAYTEVVAFNLLPAVTYYSLRSFSRRRVGDVLGAGVCWSLIALSHNITYVYAAAFLGLYFLSLFWPGVKYVRRGLRVFAGFVLGVALSAWFLAPQVYTLDALYVANVKHEPYNSRAYCTLDILLSPWRAVSDAAAPSNHLLGTQVGWLVLAGAVLAAAALLRPGRLPSGRLTIVRLLVFFALAFLMAWSPGPEVTGWDPQTEPDPVGWFWKHVPSVFLYVQFTYRLLAFTTLFGSFLLACALAAWFPRGIGRGGTVAALLIVGLFAASYPPLHPKLSRAALPALIARPDMGTAGGSSLYLVAQSALDRTDLVKNRPADDPAIQVIPVEESRKSVRTPKRLKYTATLDRPSVVQLPVFYYPHLQRVTDQGRPVPYGNVGHFLAVRLEPGAHKVVVRFVGVQWANVVSAVAWAAVIGGAAFVALRRWGRRRRNARGASAVDPGSVVGRVPVALLGSVAVGVGMAVDPFGRLAMLLEHPVEVTATADRVADQAGDPNHAFDGDITTAWVAPGTAPITLTATPERPGRLRAITFDARRTSLHETWYTVRVQAYHGEQVVADETFTFPNMATRPEHRVAMNSVAVTHLKMTFQDPVTTFPDGRKLDAGSVNPGYREIRLEWEP